MLCCTSHVSQILNGLLKGGGGGQHPRPQGAKAGHGHSAAARCLPAQPPAQPHRELGLSVLVMDLGQHPRDGRVRGRLPGLRQDRGAGTPDARRRWHPACAHGRSRHPSPQPCPGAGLWTSRDTASSRGNLGTNRGNVNTVSQTDRGRSRHSLLEAGCTVPHLLSGGGYGVQTSMSPVRLHIATARLTLLKVLDKALSAS